MYSRLARIPYSCKAALNSQKLAQHIFFSHQHFQMSLNTIYISILERRLCTLKSRRNTKFNIYILTSHATQRTRSAFSKVGSTQVFISTSSHVTQYNISEILKSRRHTIFHMYILTSHHILKSRRNTMVIIYIFTSQSTQCTRCASSKKIYAQFYIYILTSHSIQYINTGPHKLIERKPPPRGGFVFTMFPHQEPCARGPPSKHLVQILRGGSSSSGFLIREHN